MWITALSYPFIALYNAASALFRVDGNSRLPMVVSTISNVVNVALNAVFIFAFHLGAAGAALATLVSRVMCALALMYFLRQPHQSIVVRDYRKFRPDMNRIKHILRVGIPNGIENGMFQFGKLAIQSTVSTLGTTAIAAQAMTAVLESFTSHLPEGIGLGMMTIVGQCIGAGRTDEAKQNMRMLTRYAHATTAAICVVIALLVRPITTIAHMEPAAADMTVRLTYVICVVKSIIWTYSFIPAYGLRAAGDLRFCMMVSASTMWLCRVVIATVLIRGFGFGPMGVWIGMFCDWAVRGTLYTFRVRSGRWTTKRVIKT
jgi:putative MATE family efflux protein